jgi:hypothetical protein
MEAYVARVGVGVAYCKEKKVFDPSFSAKINFFLCRQDLAIPSKFGHHSFGARA